MIKPIPAITAGRENFRLEPAFPGAVTIRRDPVEPVPAGTYVVKVFEVTGYDRDCDGSLIARLAGVRASGEHTGWEQHGIGLYPGSAWVTDDPAALNRLADLASEVRAAIQGIHSGSLNGVVNLVNAAAELAEAVAGPAGISGQGASDD